MSKTTTTRVAKLGCGERWVLMAVCCVVDCCLRPWAVVATLRQYADHARIELAR